MIKFRVVTLLIKNKQHLFTILSGNNIQNYIIVNYTLYAGGSKCNREFIFRKKIGSLNDLGIIIVFKNQA